MALKEVLADDWQIKEEKYTFTKQQIIDAFMMSVGDPNSTHPYATYHRMLLQNTLEKLGIK